jgi:hypothetical protein
MMEGTAALKPPCPQYALAPVPFHHDPTAVAVNPPVGDPPRAWMWRDVPTARYPSVGVAVPIMIARNPNIVWTGARWRSFDDSHGRPNRDNHFGKNCSGA